MFFADVLLAFLIALVLTFLFIPVSSWRKDDPGRRTAATIWGFFFLVFLATWAGGVWFGMFGQPVWAGRLVWVPFLIVGVIVALMLIVAHRLGVRGHPGPEQDSLAARRERARSTPADPEPPLAGPVDPPRVPPEQRAQQEAQAVATFAMFGIVFWILAVGLAFAVVAGYWIR